MDNKDQAAPVPNFGDLPEEYSNSKRSKIVIIPAPYEASTSYNTGTKKGPRAVIEASRHMETLDDELNQETFKNGIHTREPLNLDGLSPEDMIKNLSAVVKELAQSGKLPVVLGGEHTVSIAPVTALKELHPELSVLYLDAHYDLRDELGGNRLSHACVARRISEIAPLVEVGLRSSSREGRDFLNNLPPGAKVNVIDVYGILNDAMWKEKAVDLLSKDVYISIDLDVFDPSVVPSVGTPEPGGFGWYEFMDFLRMVISKKNVVGFDVVELCPREGAPASDFLAAKLIYRLLGYLFSAKRYSG